jgi:hypothetical protein
VASTSEQPNPSAPARWGSDSPLNEITPAQTDSNAAGRKRIDADGRLRDWSGTYVVRSAADAEGCDFLVVDHVLTDEHCDLLTNAFHELEDRLFKSEGIDPFWNNRFIWLADIAAARPDAARVMIDAQRRGLGLVEKFYDLKAPLYPDLLQIVRWEAGMFMPPHADNANPDGSFHHMAHRDFAGIVYVNDNYEGGDLYFTALDIAIKPKRGMFVAMTGGFHHEHAVLRVDAGTRLTMPFFMTFDPQKASADLVRRLQEPPSPR